jgi:uncharacterized repeat protein (TIGR03803 family)
MFKRIFIGFFLLLTMSIAYAGNLFNITYSGITLPKPISITLCLNINGNTPLSCQNYISTQSNLSITTAAPNHTYQYAGIKVNTPGYTYSPIHGEHLNYAFLGIVSDTQTVTGMLSTASNYQSLLSFVGKGYNPQDELLLVNGLLYGTTPDGGAYNMGTVFSINPDGSNYNTLYSFGISTTDGARPIASLINVNGVLYGTTTNGGANSAGTVFSINPNGSNYNILYSFGTSATDGISPEAALLNINGVLYSTTPNGGANNDGTVFSINPDGSNYNILYSFGSSGTDGTRPTASLININGVLYSTTTSGGTHIQGTVFSINSDGSNYNTLYSFGSSGNDGRAPHAALINVNGVLYSTTMNGGTHHLGTIFSINPNGSNYNILYSFAASVTDGKSPEAALININGVLYGTTTIGGTYSQGTVFSINPNGSNYNTLHSFGASGDGANPYASLISVNGILYGTTINGGANSNLGTLFNINPDGSNYNKLYSLGAGSNGANPIASLLNVNGVLYGTTTIGGAYNLGTVFSVNSDGSNYNILYSFGANTADGSHPEAALIYVNGVLYGTTGFGGANSNSGTLFSINPDGTNYILFYSFGANGTTPLASLLNMNGVLYGTTSRAGTYNGGTLFSINLNGSNYNTLYSFGNNVNDGIAPQAALININGVLYSTTRNGGTNNNGTVFSINPDGSNYNTLYSFGANATDGSNPLAPLININGVLYGTTTNGGANNNAGTLYSINLNGSNYNTLHSFGAYGDGANPYASLINVNGVLYGTTGFGGVNNNAGTLFSINLNGRNYNTLHSFGASGDGANPYASLININDVLYGTTEYGGANRNSTGTVFKLE